MSDNRSPITGYPDAYREMLPRTRLDVRVVNTGPLYERLMARREQERPGYISAYVLFLATPAPPLGVWYFPIIIGSLRQHAPHELRFMAERLLEATLRFMKLLDLGQPPLLEVELTPELWPPKP